MEKKVYLSVLLAAAIMITGYNLEDEDLIPDGSIDYHGGSGDDFGTYQEGEGSYEDNCTFAGEWDTNFGIMEIIQDGDNITGTYGWDEGRLSGAISARVFTGGWAEAPTYEGPGDAGAVELILSPDCNTFSGLWYYGEKDLHKYPGEWKGTRNMSEV